MSQARERVDICVFTISDNRITEAIKSVYQRKVAIRIITDNVRFDRGSDVEALQAMAPLRVDKTSNHMHHKFALVDQRLINGSFNWSRSATDDNQVIIVVTDDAGLISQFEDSFEYLWRRFD